MDLTNIFNQITATNGAIVGLLSIGVWLVFLTWRNTATAKTERQRADTERDKQDTKRDDTITEIANKATRSLEDIATLGISLAEERGKVNLLTVQLEHLRDKNQREREELKTSIRALSDKLEGYEAEISELKASVNGKALEIKALTLERDELGNQLKDRDAKIMYLEKQVSTLEEQIHGLRLKAEESALQIETLGNQLAILDPVKTGDTGKMKVIIDATIDKTTTVGENQKELSKKSED